MKYLYSAMFHPDGGKIIASVPDLPGCVTSGRDMQDALDHARGDVFSLVQIDTLAYRAATDTRAVRKNVSLPAWMATLADRRGINCSQVLQEGLTARLNAG